MAEEPRVDERTRGPQDPLRRPIPRLTITNQSPRPHTQKLGQSRRPRRVFWIVDNGSSHRGQPSIDRLQERWPNLVLVHLPFYASWLKQIEMVFSVIQRKV